MGGEAGNQSDDQDVLSWLRNRMNAIKRTEWVDSNENQPVTEEAKQLLRETGINLSAAADAVARKAIDARTSEAIAAFKRNFERETIHETLWAVSRSKHEVTLFTEPGTDKHNPGSVHRYHITRETDPGVVYPPWDDDVLVLHSDVNFSRSVAQAAFGRQLNFTTMDA